MYNVSGSWTWSLQSERVTYCRLQNPIQRRECCQARRDRNSDAFREIDSPTRIDHQREVIQERVRIIVAIVQGARRKLSLSAALERL